MNRTKPSPATNAGEQGDGSASAEPSGRIRSAGINERNTTFNVSPSIESSQMLAHSLFDPLYVLKMNAYEIRVNGVNFLISMDEKLEKHGFFINIYVESESEVEAEYKAMNIIRGMEKLRSSVKNEKDDPPRMNVDEISQISNYDEIEHKVQGLIWYKEDEESV